MSDPRTHAGDSASERAGSLALDVGKTGPFQSPEQELYLNLLRTHEQLSTEFDRFFRGEGLSQAKYNVLRILRGHERRAEQAGRAFDGVRSSLIGREMVTRLPDVTRIVDRLAEDGLVERVACPEDRRVIWVRLCPAGRELLDRLEAPLAEIHRRQLAHLDQAQIGALNELLYLARSE